MRTNEVPTSARLRDIWDILPWSTEQLRSRVLVPNSYLTLVLRISWSLERMRLFINSMSLMPDTKTKNHRSMIVWHLKLCCWHAHSLQLCFGSPFSLCVRAYQKHPLYKSCLNILFLCSFFAILLLCSIKLSICTAHLVSLVSCLPCCLCSPLFAHRRQFRWGKHPCA